MPDEVERKGIGTSATRASTIEKLVRIGFVERKGNKKTKYLMPTHKGVALITVMPEQIQSPSMTAEWEQKLLDVEKGVYEDSSFMTEIEEMITGLVKNYKIIEDAEVLMHPALEEIGICPCCGKHVVEKQKGYFCENRGCCFVLWKENRFFETLGKKMTKQTATKLLRDGKVELKGCKSQKTGKTYDTTVVMMVDENQRAVFQLDFKKGDFKMEKVKTKKIKKWDEVHGEYEVEVSEDTGGSGSDEVAGAGPSISRNPMRGIEDMVEQNDNNFDGIINNVKVESSAGTLEIVPDDKKSVLEKLKEQSRQAPQPAPAPERKPVPGCCFEREITG